MVPRPDLLSLGAGWRASSAHELGRDAMCSSASRDRPRLVLTQLFRRLLVRHVLHSLLSRPQTEGAWRAGGLHLRRASPSLGLRLRPEPCASFHMHLAPLDRERLLRACNLSAVTFGPPPLGAPRTSSRCCEPFRPRQCDVFHACRTPARWEAPARRARAGRFPREHPAPPISSRFWRRGCLRPTRARVRRYKRRSFTRARPGAKRRGMSCIRAVAGRRAADLRLASRFERRLRRRTVTAAKAGRVVRFSSRGRGLSTLPLPLLWLCPKPPDLRRAARSLVRTACVVAISVRGPARTAAAWRYYADEGAVLHRCVMNDLNPTSRRRRVVAARGMTEPPRTRRRRARACRPSCADAPPPLAPAGLPIHRARAVRVDPAYVVSRIATARCQPATRLTKHEWNPGPLRSGSIPQWARDRAASPPGARSARCAAAAPAADADAHADGAATGSVVGAGTARAPEGT